MTVGSVHADVGYAPAMAMLSAYGFYDGQTRDDPDGRTAIKTGGQAEELFTNLKGVFLQEQEGHEHEGHKASSGVAQCHSYAWGILRCTRNIGDPYLGVLQGWGTARRYPTAHSEQRAQRWSWMC